MTYAIILMVVAVAGYVAGRTRPYGRLQDWANWQLRFHADRWLTRPRRAALLVLLLLTDTRKTMSALWETGRTRGGDGS